MIMLALNCLIVVGFSSIAFLFFICTELTERSVSEVCVEYNYYVTTTCIVIRCNGSCKGRCNTSTQMLYEILERVWEQETITAYWKEDYLIKTPKRETYQTVTVRRIAMVVVPRKILSPIILQRLIDELGEALGEQKVDFIKDRSCANHCRFCIQRCVYSCLHVIKIA